MRVRRVPMDRLNGRKERGSMDSMIEKVLKMGKR